MFYQIGTKDWSKRIKIESLEKMLDDYVSLFTCKRAEIYTTENIKIDLPRTKGKEALKHLLYVACGIDSLVIGEIEILEQVNNALKRALKERHCSNELSEYFNFAIDKAKEIRAITDISVSFSSIFVDKIIYPYRHHKKPPIIVVGTGTLGRKLIESLKNEEYPFIYFATKSAKRRKQIRKEYNIPPIKLKEIKNNSIIVVATEHVSEEEIDILKKKGTYAIYDLRHENYSSLVKELRLIRNISIDKVNKTKKLINLNVKKFKHLTQKI